MINEITIRQGQYAPGRLIAPKTEALFWRPVTKDQQGNETAEVLCPRAVELRFLKPSASPNFHIVVRGAVAEGMGDEWTILLPSDRMGILFIPQGFTAEQSIMGAVYRLPEPHDLRILADQLVGMPGLNLTVQVIS